MVTPDDIDKRLRINTEKLISFHTCRFFLPVKFNGIEITNFTCLVKVYVLNITAENLMQKYLSYF